MSATDMPDLERLDERVGALVDGTLSLAREKERDDLVGRLSSERLRAGGSAVTIVVAGEAKRGKSSLVNALLARPAVESPVDDVVATSAHLVIQFSPTSYVRVFHDACPFGEDVPPSSLSDWATEAGNPRNAKRVRSIEIGLDHPLLEQGVALVDTPGVGGLEAAHADVTLAALSAADVLVFVSDASAPLSGPELGFLDRVTERIGNVFLVLTKIDAYPGADEVIAANRALLAQTRYRDAPFFAVSSLRKRKADDRASASTDVRERLRDLSGFAELERALVAHAVGRTRALRLANVVQLGRIVLDRLAESEHALVEGAKGNSSLKEELEAARDRLERLRAARRIGSSAVVDEFSTLQTEVEAELDRALDELEQRERQALQTGKVKLADVPEHLDAELNAVVARLNAALATGVSELVVDLAAALALEGLGSIDTDAAAGSGDGSLPRVPALPARTGIERVLDSTRAMTYVPERLLGGLAAVALGGPLGAAVGVFAGLAVLGLTLVQGRRVRDRQEAIVLLTAAVGIAKREIPPIVRARVRELRATVEASVLQAIRDRDRELAAAIREYERTADEDERARAQAEAAAAGRRDVLEGLRAEADALLEGLAAPPAAVFASVS